MTTTDALTADDLRDVLVRTCNLVDALLLHERQHGGVYSGELWQTQRSIDAIRELLAMTTAPAAGTIH